MSRKLFVGLLVTLLVVGLGVSVVAAAEPDEAVSIPSYLVDTLGLEVVPFEDADGKPEGVYGKASQTRLDDLANIEIRGLYKDLKDFDPSKNINLEPLTPGGQPPFDPNTLGDGGGLEGGDLFKPASPFGAESNDSGNTNGLDEATDSDDATDSGDAEEGKDAPAPEEPAIPPAAE